MIFTTQVVEGVAMSFGIRLRDAVVALLIGAVCVGVAVAIARLVLVPAVGARVRRKAWAGSTQMK